MEHRQGIRKALLERLATDINIMVTDPCNAEKWTCCWIPYTGPNGERWLWRSCGELPGAFPRLRACDHWHHQWEIFLA